MKRPALNKREQALLGLTLTLVVLGLYAWLRFLPANRTIFDLQQSAAATQKRLAGTVIADEPDRNVADLDEQLAVQKHDMSLLKSQAETVSARQAPTESRELIVAISQLAYDFKIRVLTNELSKPPAQTAPIQAQAQPVRGKKAKKRAAAKPARTDIGGALILTASRDWVARMSPGTVFNRPMQRVELEGSYQALLQFIHGLDQLAYRVVIARIAIEKTAILPPSGYPQTLRAELIVAL